ncbi:DUF4166 domain-containing protein [Psychromicrobium lacuslunae]|uniref:DUF4166 domain-containing protein n=1 Tax=Psychromicrobium lacuslunae TaxID=1618207 RepID=UPI0005D35A08|nr:DUF4166 domain-containing protein [Psychromicrobium lacuslunae]
MSSVWEAAHPGLLDQLHPRLQSYFSEIPVGQVGRGSGIFDRVGSPHRWLWPVFLVLSWDRIIFPVWQSEVRFEIENRPQTAQGVKLIRARRSFHFEAGSRVMIDAITAEPASKSTTRLVDYLGSSGRLAASLLVSAQNGQLELRSEAISVRLLGRRFTLPRVIAPTVQITEGVDESTGLQRISMELRQPQLGLLYQYQGRFNYQIESD